MSLLKRFAASGSLALLAFGYAGIAHGDVIYNSIPDPLVHSPSLAFQATGTSEAGEAVSLAGDARGLQSVTVGLSDFAKQSDWSNVGDLTGFDLPLTINIYNLNLGDGSVGSLIATDTTTQHVLWRPEDSPSCGAGQWLPAPSDCYAGGLAQTATFDFSSQGITLPNNIVVTLSFDTETYGTSPLGADGPYDSLNLSLTPAVTIGSNVYAADAALYWNSVVGAFYTDGGAGGTGVLREDTEWTQDGNNLNPSFQISATPEPGTVVLMLSSLAGLAFMVRRRRTN